MRPVIGAEVQLCIQRGQVAGAGAAASGDDVRPEYQRAASAWFHHALALIGNLLLHWRTCPVHG